MASYAYGLAKNYPFVDGNKRAALLATGLILALSGQRLVVAQAEATVMVLDLAAGEITEAIFANWLRAHLRSP